MVYSDFFYAFSVSKHAIQDAGGELDSHEEVRLSFASPGETKSREVNLFSELKLDNLLLLLFSTAVLRTLSL